jgi:predicted deacylase
MNRFYPGNPAGTQTERASDLITRQVVDQSDHSDRSARWRPRREPPPLQLLDRHGRAAQDSISRAMVIAFGLDHVIISSDRPKDPAASRYLENTASTRGKPSITAEAGQRRHRAAGGRRGAGRRLAQRHGLLHMLERPRPRKKTFLWFDRVVTVTSDSAGIFYPLIERDAWVTRGTKLGYVTDYLGRRLTDLVAPEAGLVLYINALPTM